MITVKQLIEYLQTQPQELPVAYRCCSEQCLMELNDIDTLDLCYPRADGWLQNERPDMPTQTYIVFPGN